MVNSVTLNGNTYNDGSTPPNNLGDGGHRTYFFPMLQDFLAEAQSRANAVGLPVSGNSSSSLTIANTGTITPYLSTGKNWVAGTRLRLSRTAAPSTWMEGIVNSYNSSTGLSNITLDASNGSGTY